MASPAWLVGIDVGTTNWKVAAYDEDGRELAVYRQPAAVHAEPGGRAYYDPQEIWQAVCTGLARVVQELGGPSQARRVVGVAATSMGEAGVLLDGAGQPLYPAIAWFDPRTHEQLEFWKAHADPYRIYEITGFPLQYIPSLNKMMWLARHEPERFERARRWLCLADYVAFRLSGEQAMDPNLASRTMAFDIVRRQWSGELLERAGIDPALLPPVLGCGTRLGRLRPEVAGATGLPPTAAVAVGGQDHWCGALAAGVVRAGDVLDSTGTAEALILVVERPTLSRQAFDAGLASGCHTVEGLYYVLGGLQTAGGAIEWVREAIGQPEQEAARQAGEGAEGVYRRLMETASRAPCGSGGLLFLPHLRGCVNPPDALSKGAWVGLRPFHGRAEMLRSVVEGLAYEFAEAVERLAGLSDSAVRRVAAIGGGTRNELWLQLKADVSGLPLEVAAAQEATTLGAAVLAGVGAGVYRDAVEGAVRVHRVARTVEPRAEFTERYRPLREAYRALYPALAALHARLEALSGSG